MASETDAAQRFLRLHSQPGAFVMPNPWDIGSARILAGMGYRALATSSQAFAFTQGYEDGHIERDQMLEHCADVVAAVDVPVSADLEHGYGETTAGVADTYRLAATVGLAGASIEDFSGTSLYEVAEAAQRVEAAVDGINSAANSLVLTARAEGFLRGKPDLGDVIARLNRYAQAGAHVLYAPGLPDLKALQTLCSEVSLPVNALVVGSLAQHSVAELAQAGAARLSVGSMLSRHVLGRLVQAAHETLEQGSFAWTGEIGAGPQIDGVMRTL